jgi:hypothetical protein
MPSVVTNPFTIILASIHATPALRWRCGIIRSATRLFEVSLIPVRAVRHAFEKRVVLLGAHGVDRNIEVPCLTHIIRLGFLALVWEDS